MQVLKRIVARLPNSWQTELKRFYFSLQIRKGTFVTDEPEYDMLDDLISSGDWVIDVGANIGHYTKRFSELVGKHGRVISFEPVPATFSLLSANTQRFREQNVSLINAAVSDKFAAVGMSLPKFETGLDNYYEAQIASFADAAVSVLSMSVDSLCIKRQIALIKIDAEGHEAFVLAGMKKLIETSRPVLIIETDSKELIGNLTSLGYTSKKLKNSPNYLFIPKKRIEPISVPLTSGTL
ncbi:MAG: FkbM family methyltransferase [Proteobacteria bacterium]|nr:FkbM family methyltransferase [Pseudomonadota bacterium]MBU1544359.1 FkbM family methyltransferase [Pseudomonadota bacterium]MBU2479903.1 FkbM family methyltransferase [Pseudomonadota bacterium]